MFRKVEGKMGRMRKAVDWVVCPVSTNSPNQITIQCERYIAQLDTDTNKVIMSDGKGGHPGFHKLQKMFGAKEIDAPQWLLDQLADLEQRVGPVENGPVVLMDANGVAPTVVAKKKTLAAGVNIFDL